MYKSAIACLFAGLGELLLHELPVLVEAALDGAHGAVGADPQLAAHHPDEPLVVRHENHASLRDARRSD